MTRSQLAPRRPSERAVAERATSELATRPAAEMYGWLEVQRFQSETAEIVHAPEPVRSRATLLALAALLASLVLISTVFQLDRVVTSISGAVATVQPTVVLQALDASIIKTLDVTEGQQVRRGQLLATLDATFAAADTDTLRLQMSSLNAQIARAEAELAHQPLVIPPSREPGAQQYAVLQTAYYDQRRSQFDSQVKGYDEQIAQAQATLAKLDRDQALYGQRQAIADNVEAMRIELEKHEVGSKLDLLAAQDGRTEMQRFLEFDRSGMVETQHQLAAAVANRIAFVQQWLGQTSQELVTARNERDAALQALAKATRHQDLVRVLAPADAIVLSLPSISVGSVLREGDPLISLAELSSPVEADIRIAARDIGFVRAGDPVTIKFDAYNFVEHGAARGRVLWLSEGTFNTDAATGGNTDPLGRPVPPYYKARVAFTRVALHGVPASFRVIPGMTLDADIHVGTRSLFMYLVRGLVRGVDEAMREP